MSLKKFSFTQHTPSRRFLFFLYFHLFFFFFGAKSRVQNILLKTENLCHRNTNHIKSNVFQKSSVSFFFKLDSESSHIVLLSNPIAKYFVVFSLLNLIYVRFWLSSNPVAYEEFSLNKIFLFLMATTNIIHLSPFYINFDYLIHPLL